MQQIIIVTGASAGIGRATTLTLAAAGATVIAIARRAERLDSVVAEAQGLPGHVLPIAGDVRDAAFVNQMMAATAATFGRIDVLVNNAGIGHRSPLSTMPAEDITTLLDTNLVALLHLSQAAIAQMRQQGHGQIINVSSIVSVRPLPQSGLYTASKAAVDHVSRALRMELRHDNITVTLVYPGLTRTDFGEARLGEKGINRFGVKGVAPERVAHKIARAIERQQTEVTISAVDWLFMQVNRHFPRLTDWLFGRLDRFA